MDIKDRVLIVEDDKSIRNFLRTVLEANNFDVITAVTGAEAYSMATSQCPDLVILDLGLPDMDGMKILKGIREWSAMPILVVSARSHERDKVEALDAGADDYITKPFNILEVKARVKALLRRSAATKRQQEQDKRLTSGGLTIDPDARAAWKNDQPVELTAREFDLLELLMKHPNRVYSREQLLNQVWGYEYTGEYRTVDVHVRRLREKVEDDPASPTLLCTKWGVGYYFHGQ